MTTHGNYYLYLVVYYKYWLFRRSVYCFNNAFLHLLVSKSFITSLTSLFKYKLFRRIIVFNLYLSSGPVKLYQLDKVISNFKYKLFRRIIVFNLYLSSGPVKLYQLDKVISNFRVVFILLY